MKHILIVLLLSVAGWAQDTPKSATAVPWNTGNDFLQVCSDTSDYSMQSLECVSYVMGVWDGFVLGKPGQSYCINDEATPLQLKRIVVKYISAHPERAHTATASLTIDAIQAAFPCPSK